MSKEKETKKTSTKEQKLYRRTNFLIPIYDSISNDFLFWSAVDAFFLQDVKHFQNSEIISLATIGLLSCIILQFLLIFVIRKIGNTASIRAGSVFLLAASLLMTFGKSFWVIALGKVLYEISMTLQAMISAILRDMLELQGKPDEYSKLKARGNTIYSVIAMIISAVVMKLYTDNNYLPMYGCIAFCVLALILSFFVKDTSPYNRIVFDKSEKEKREKNSFKKLILENKVILVTIVAYAIGYSIIDLGQSNQNLYMKQQFQAIFTAKNAALIFGAVVFISRIVKVVGNMTYNVIHKKLGDKLGYTFATLEVLSFVLLLVGGLAAQNVIAKLIIIAIGYSIIIFVRDPIQVFFYDFAMKNVAETGKQYTLTTMEFIRKSFEAGFGAVISAILVGSPLKTVLVLFAIFAVVEVAISFVLCQMEKKKEALAE